MSHTRSLLILLAVLGVLMAVVFLFWPDEPGGSVVQAFPEDPARGGGVPLDAPAEGADPNGAEVSRVVAPDRKEVAGRAPTRPSLKLRVEQARTASGLGQLTDDELGRLVELLVGLEKSMTDQRYGYVSSGGSARSFEFVDMTYDIEGARAKAKALLEHSYVLLPVGSALGPEILGDEAVHVAVGPGGVRGETSFQTHIVIDLNRDGRFASALRDWARLAAGK